MTKTIKTFRSYIYKWKINMSPDFTIFLRERPKLWTRFGIWVWFGLRVKELNND